MFCSNISYNLRNDDAIESIVLAQKGKQRKASAHLFAVDLEYTLHHEISLCCCNDLAPPYIKASSKK